MSNYYNRSNKSKQLTLGELVVFIEKNAKYISALGQKKYLINDDLSNMEKIYGKDIYDKSVKLEPEETNKIAKINQLPKNLQIIFEEYGINRAGIVSKLDTDNTQNVSFIASIFYLLLSEYRLYRKSQQIEFIRNFSRIQSQNAKRNFGQYGYAKLYGWVFKEFRENISSLKPTKHLFKYIIDQMCVNIFVANTKEDSITFFGDEAT